MQNFKMSSCLRTPVGVMGKWILKDVDSEKRGPMTCAQIMNVEALLPGEIYFPGRLLLCLTLYWKGERLHLTTPFSLARWYLSSENNLQPCNSLEISFTVDSWSTSKLGVCQNLEVREG